MVRVVNKIDSWAAVNLVLRQAQVADLLAQVDN